MRFSVGPLALLKNIGQLALLKNTACLSCKKCSFMFMLMTGRLKFDAKHDCSHFKEINQALDFLMLYFLELLEKSEHHFPEFKHSGQKVNMRLHFLQDNQCVCTHRAVKFRFRLHPSCTWYTWKSQISFAF